jgi:HlyD family secretion protein
MNASADIKTRRVENVLAVPIAAVSARVKGSDQSMADKKKEKEDSKDENEAQNQNGVVVEGDELEEVAFVLMPDGTVKKRVVKTGVQDINYIEIVSGLKEGEELVTAPYAAVSKDLKDGAKVTVVPKDKLFDKK